MREWTSRLRRAVAAPRAVCIALVGLVAAAGPPALAETTAANPAAGAKPPPCATAEHRQFDFWLGDWEVRGPAGKVLGRNRITTMHGGCVLLESWTATGGGVTGSSFNLYDAERRKWHQTWVDSGGNLLLLEGGWVDGRMVLTGENVEAAKPGVVTQSRISWQPLPDGRVRQHWETSTDRGRTWTTAFDGYYSRN